MQTLTFRSQEIRVQEQSDTTWFCAVDITRILGYKNSAQAVADNVDPKHIRQISLGKKGKPPIFVSEPGLYQLVLKSKLPAAIEFKIGSARKCCQQFAKLADTSGKCLYRR